MSRKSKKPENCEHSRLDGCWGEYKCTYYGRRIYDSDECKTCINFKDSKEEVEDKHVEGT